ncbi:MAG: C-type lectin domain-containing protein [Lachnospiraceae bacterium]|nr:C-type lectin domain-containing protein [Lachnospiraceae bacterium]
MIRKGLVYFLLLVAGIGGSFAYLVGAEMLNDNGINAFYSQGTDNSTDDNSSGNDSSGSGEDIVIINEDASAGDASQADLTSASATADTTQTSSDQSEGGIHSYAFYKDDGSWSEAFIKAQQAGGYLARINSQEEFDYIVNQISSYLIKSSEMDSVILFQIGGRRDSDSTSYYWVDENNTTYGEALNGSDSWAAGNWMDGEPSYQDSYGESTTTEDCLVLYYYNGAWAFNDSTDDIVSWFMADAGKVGYIVEFEN